MLPLARFNVTCGSSGATLERDNVHALAHTRLDAIGCDALEPASSSWWLQVRWCTQNMETSGRMLTVSISVSSNSPGRRQFGCAKRD